MRFLSNSRVFCRSISDRQLEFPLLVITSRQLFWYPAHYIVYGWVFPTFFPREIFRRREGGAKRKKLNKNVETAKEGNEEGTSFSWQFILVSIYVIIVGCFLSSKHFAWSLQVNLHLSTRASFSSSFFPYSHGPRQAGPCGGRARYDSSKHFAWSLCRYFCTCGGDRVLRMTVQRMPRPSPSPALKEFLLIKVERAAFVLEALSFPDTFRAGYRTLLYVCIPSLRAVRIGFRRRAGRRTAGPQRLCLPKYLQRWRGTENAFALPCSALPEFLSFGRCKVNMTFLFMHNRTRPSMTPFALLLDFRSTRGCSQRAKFLKLCFAQRVFAEGSV
jgi:hypothetical protein